MIDNFKFRNLQAVADELSKCTRCGSCHASCPTYELSLKESLSARGKIRLAEGLINNELNLSDRIVSDFSECLSCMLCKSSCPVGVDTLKILDSVKFDIYESKAGFIGKFIYKYILPYPERLNILATLAGIGSYVYEKVPSFLVSILPFARNRIRRKLPDLLKRNLRNKISYISKSKAADPIGKVAYFSGCMTDLSFTKTGEDLVDILNRLGFDLIFPKSQLCCGAPAYFKGDLSATINLAKENLKALSKLDVDLIVCSCATCASVLKEIYPKILKDDNKAKMVAEKIFDFQEIAVKSKIEKLFSMKADPEKKIRVTYHDPCHLKRGIGIYKQPRDLLASIPLFEFVEMEGADLCCGGAGAFSLEHYDTSMKQGKRKAEWIKKANVEFVVTECPSCELQLVDSINRFIDKDRPKVISSASIVDYALSKSDNGNN